MEFSQSIYLTVTIIGVGAILLDLLGLIGHHGHDGDGGSFNGHHLSHNLEDQKSDSSHLAIKDTGENVLTPQKIKEKSQVIFFFSFLRNLIYFFLGFGPAGLISSNQLSSKAVFFVSFGFGILTVIGVQIFRKLMRKELDSQMREEDFIMETGTVIVTIPKGQIGKVRIMIDGSFYDRFAKGKDMNKTYLLNSKIHVVEAVSDLLIVEEQELN